MSFLLRDVKKVAIALCDGLAGPRSDELKKLITEDLWDQYVNVTIDPGAYQTSEDYFKDVACASFLKKYEPLPTSFDRKAKAYANFWAAEKKCFRTNQRLYPFIYKTYESEDEPMSSFLTSVKKWVTNLIGDGPPSNPEGRFGPGATFSDKGGLTTIHDKMQQCPQLTRDAIFYLFPFSGTWWSKASIARGETYVLQRGDRFTTAPKDAKTHRGISIQPSLNIFYQLAFGKAMRKALKKRTNHWVDLDTAQTIHRQVACEASRTGAFATIDLSQASDTVCSALVRLVTPHRWYAVLNDLRSPTTTISEGGVDKIVVLEKFSAMGNGYTFELETVIFMAICCTVMESLGYNPKPGVNVYVFGDDIIVPTEFAQSVISALRYCGFETNASKTFVSGPFRESCGGDYFNGVDVRPFFLKEEANEPQHFLGIANGIRRMAGDSHAYYNPRWYRVRSAWFAAIGVLPTSIKSCRGPSELGDICLHDDESTWKTRWKFGWRYVKVYRPARYRKVKWAIYDDDVQLAAALYGVPWGNGEFTPRDSVIGYRIGWVPFS